MPRLVEAASCPACGSSEIRTKSRYGRKVRTLKGVETFPVTQHCCRSCQHAFTDVIEGVKHGCQIADEVKMKAATLYIDGPDLEGVKRWLSEDLCVRISASTIWRAVNLAATAARGVEMCNHFNAKLSEFVCVDEKFISVHGRKKPQFFAICPKTGVIATQKLLRKREEVSVAGEFRKLKRMGFKVCISDDWKAYPAAAKAAGMRHQKCQFHAKQTCFRIMKKKHIQKKRKEKFLGWLFAFLDSKSLEEATVWLRVVGRMKKEKKLGRFIKSFFSDWENYFTYLEFPSCPKTSNPIEQFNRRFEQKRQTMHGFRKERSARGFTALFSLHSAFRKFESGVHAGLSPLELAGVSIGSMKMFDLLL